MQEALPTVCNSPLAWRFAFCISTGRLLATQHPQGSIQVACQGAKITMCALGDANAHIWQLLKKTFWLGQPGPVGTTHPLLTLDYFLHRRADCSGMTVADNSGTVQCTLYGGGSGIPFLVSQTGSTTYVKGT